ncbi:MAG: hypothetical protein MUC88_18010 [Planctomycetes bacterium]|jgi:hypothetical protein|nr:hypothetical protein [Planctomycetota bacterium]
MGSHRMESSRVDVPFNARNVTTTPGAIERLDTCPIESASAEGLRLHVKTDAGQSVVANVGPRSYLDREKIAFHAGDQVTITGSPAQMGGQDVIVASQIKTRDKILKLRDRERRQARASVDGLVLARIVPGSRSQEALWGAETRNFAFGDPG